MTKYFCDKCDRIFAPELLVRVVLGNSFLAELCNDCISDLRLWIKQKKETNAQH